LQRLASVIQRALYPNLPRWHIGIASDVTPFAVLALNFLGYLFELLPEIMLKLAGFLS